ncbi:sigma factor regulator VreR [Oxalicibacterium flavum]|uniref:Sigma factor regulator VreR n=1 Tax=Oxalicibacterium flavum TaxID=179467 RepID=A0A8J2UJ92_9BURK|nr:FecR domain-containing protein [Oxalicibacterium flavum]GGB95514.1 sigma factor regulator VreR [Oxalicibacterium flavum]
MNELEKQAHAWVRRMRSGALRPRDARALARWCAISTAHEEAFRAAQQKWNDLLPAAALAGIDDSELAMLRAGRNRRNQMDAGRRLFLGGVLAASAATGVVLLYSPMDLLPSITSAWQADYRTATGEQRSISLTSDVIVNMNTRSSIAVQRAGMGEVDGIRLLEGEVAVQMERPGRPFVVATGLGRLQADQASFEVRVRESGECVTCTAGSLRVTVAGMQLVLHANQQVVYDSNGMQPIRTLQAEQVSTWGSGILTFSKTALEEVIAEINRYRPGRVVLLAGAVRDKPVSGRFQIRDLDGAIAQIQRLFHLDVKNLPGGIVLLR